MPDASQKNFEFPITLVTNVAEGVRLVDEEQFGPGMSAVKQVLPFCIPMCCLGIGSCPR